MAEKEVRQLSNSDRRAARSANMRAVKSRDTKPEIIVRRTAHAMGYRFRLHFSGLPGRPDLTFPRRKAVIFVHGCFWHGHDCGRGTRPKTNSMFWDAKLKRNKERDQEQLNALSRAGWRTMIVWECQTKDRRSLAESIGSFLG